MALGHLASDSPSRPGCPAVKDAGLSSVLRTCEVVTPYIQTGAQFHPQESLLSSCQGMGAGAMGIITSWVPGILLG